MTALEFLKTLIYIPVTREGGYGHPSNSQIKRWLRKGSVIINGKKPQPEDEIEFPIRQLVFFPKGKRVTMV